MRELSLAVHPSLDPAPRPGSSAQAWPRQALVASVLVHLAIAWAASRAVFTAEAPPPAATGADFVWVVERLLPPRPLPVAEPTPALESVIELPLTSEAAVVERTDPAVTPEPAAPAPPPAAELELPAPAFAPPERSPEPLLRNSPGPFVAPGIDFDEERRRAAAEVVAERAAEDSYLTFSIDDVAPPRSEPEPRRERSIFDPGRDSGGGSIGEVGQARTRFGRKLSELCNALTGGFGFSMLGRQLFSACAEPDDEPSGLFPEVRPAYLDLLPECAESQPENPELAAASPFSTVKCRLVRPELPARGPPR